LKTADVITLFRLCLCRDGREGHHRCLVIEN